MKAQNQTMSVCEIGATIGRMWRELSDEEKQKHNDDFTQAKVIYLSFIYDHPLIYYSSISVCTIFEILYSKI